MTFACGRERQECSNGFLAGLWRYSIPTEIPEANLVRKELVIAGGRCSLEFAIMRLPTCDSPVDTRHLLSPGWFQVLNKQARRVFLLPCRLPRRRHTSNASSEAWGSLAPNC
jgi:hypothetical protein